MSPVVKAAEAATVPVNVYVVCLEGVNAIGVGNMSRVLDGVLKASSPPAGHLYQRIRWWTGEEREISAFYSELVLEEIPINVSVTVVADWTAYRILIEYASNVIIVNAHGEILPVPAGYSKEGWTDRIAQAMLYKNVSWVHVGGYPFYMVWLQNMGEAEWGEQGFKHLMSHVGKGNATCWPLPYPQRYSPAGLSGAARWWLAFDWGGCIYASWVSSGYRLEKDFRKLIVWPYLHGGEGGPYPDAVVRFAQGNETYNFGFYVHFGAEQTYNWDGNETDRDFFGAYVAAATAIRAHVMKAESLEAMKRAEAAIAKAQREGRTKGLEKAIDLLNQAKEEFASNFYDGVLRYATKAQDTANQAISPSFLESYGLIIAVSTIIGASAGAATIKWRNNKRKNSNNRSENM
ncbi:MAG: hypothetical protein K6T73_11120 [Candidatus Bathyarchaeota archaeon]|nr:hypothetical protein [Candidatus Bathyarchaeota archaeon]